MIVLGIDPGTATVGYAILKTSAQNKNNIKVIDFGCITTECGMVAGDRLKKIHKEIGKIIDKHGPNLMSVESLYFFKNLKTVMPVSQAKGVILLAASEKRIPVLEFTPLQVKMTVVGYGRAEKKQVQEMTKKILDLKNFDIQKNNRKKDDATDALGVALCALYKKF